MKKYILLAILSVLVAILSCSKTKNEKDCDNYYINLMKDKWRMISVCTVDFHPYLGKGIYQSKVVYYTSISCSMCMVALPEKVVSCSGDSISVSNWNEVTETKVLARCTDL